MATTCVYNVFVGAETGLLKGIQTAERTWQNLNSIEDASRSREITCLCWGSKNKTELCAGLRDNCVLTFEAAGASATEHGPFFGASGHIKAVSKFDDKFVTGFSGGMVAVWTGSGDEEDTVKITTGDNLWALAQNSAEPNHIATGGKENPVKLWDFTTQQAVFTAKNVRHDWLNLRVPIWVTKVQFCMDNRRMVSCTGYSQVRVYDPKVQRRPVVDFEVFKSTALTALSVCPQREEQVIVGSAKGDMGLVDLRKRQIVHLFRGFSGGITDIQCHAAAPVVASASVDRFVRIHDIESRTLQDKFYLKSRLNCLLLSDEWPENEGTDQWKKRTRKTEVKEAEGSGQEAEADDAMWDSLEVVKTRTVSEDLQSGNAQKRQLEEGEGDEVKALKKSKGQKKKKKRIGSAPMPLIPTPCPQSRPGHSLHSSGTGNAQEAVNVKSSRGSPPEDMVHCC